MEIKRNLIVAFIGAKGSGKTREAASMYGLESRAMVYNVADDSQFKIRSQIVAYGGLDALGRVAGAVRRSAAFRISFSPTDLDFSENKIEAATFEKMCEIAYETGNLTLYLDEAHMLLNSNAASAPPYFRRIVFMGRHKQVSLAYIAHRISSIPRALSFNTNRFIFFQTAEPRDLDYIAEVCGTEVAEKVKTLRRLDLTGAAPVPGQYYDWDNDRREGKIVDAT